MWITNHTRERKRKKKKRNVNLVQPHREFIYSTNMQIPRRKNINLNVLWNKEVKVQNYADCRGSKDVGGTG